MSFLLRAGLIMVTAPMEKATGSEVHRRYSIALKIPYAARPVSPRYFPMKMESIT